MTRQMPRCGDSGRFVTSRGRDGGTPAGGDAASVRHAARWAAGVRGCGCHAGGGTDEGCAARVVFAAMPLATGIARWGARCWMAGCGLAGGVAAATMTAGAGPLTARHAARCGGRGAGGCRHGGGGTRDGCADRVVAARRPLPVARCGDREDTADGGSVAVKYGAAGGARMPLAVARCGAGWAIAGCGLAGGTDGGCAASDVLARTPLPVARWAARGEIADGGSFAAR